jgi:hypothetical protein
MFCCVSNDTFSPVTLKRLNHLSVLKIWKLYLWLNFTMSSVFTHDSGLILMVNNVLHSANGGCGAYVYPPPVYKLFYGVNITSAAHSHSYNIHKHSYISTKRISQILRGLAYTPLPPKCKHASKHAT